MALDQSKIGEVAASLMENAETHYGDNECQVGDVMVIAEIVGPHGSEICVQPSSPRNHVNAGLLLMASHFFRLHDRT